MIEPLTLQPLPEAAEALRADVRRFLDEALAGIAPEVRARSWLGFDAEFSRALGARGWIGLALPREYGGGGRDAFARFVLVEELLARGAPVSAHWIAERQSAPMILRYGTEAQKRFFVPPYAAASCSSDRHERAAGRLRPGQRANNGVSTGGIPDDRCRVPVGRGRLLVDARRFAGVGSGLRALTGGGSRIRAGFLPRRA